MNKGYKIIRIITVAPVLAAAMLIIIGSFRNEVFPAGWHMIYSFFFLGILPLLAYPLQPYIPGYKDKGREGQRNLAILFAVIGFTLGCIISFAFPSSIGLKIIFMEYFLEALVILLFNKVFHIKISGHACGALAPVALFIHFNLYAAALAGICVTALVFVASIKTKQHTFWQLLGGGFASIAGMIFIELYVHLQDKTLLCSL